MTGASLDRLQQWMQSVITHPGGVEAGAVAPDARSALDVDVAEVVEPSATLAPEERIGVYGRMYFDRLVEVLEDEFAAVRDAAGGVAFAGLARDYLVAHPSTSYTLNDLGARFPVFVRDEAEGLDPQPFLAELASLERAVQEVFDAPRVEPIGVDELLGISDEAWAGARMELVPALRVFAFRYPTNAWYQAFRDDERRPPVEERATWTAVYRRDFRVWRKDIGREEHAILAELGRGAPLGAALEVAAALPGVDVAELAGAVRTWFQDWTGLGFFRAVRV